MNRRRLLPALLTLVAILVFAASASAEVRTGEATSPVDSGIPGELDLLDASAYYDSTTGTAKVTSRVRETPTGNAENVLQAAFFTSRDGTCSTAAGKGGGAYPAFVFLAPYSPPTAEWISVEKEGESFTPGNSGEASKALVGTTTTLATATPQATNRPYNCALVGTEKSGGEGKAIDVVAFPIVVPPAPPVVTPPAPSPPAPPAPAALSIAKNKPLTVKVGKWTKLKFTVSNPGGVAAGPVTLKLKAPAGVVLKGASVKLPALLAGQSWPITVAAKLTPAAKKSSTVSLTGTVAGLTATSSIVIKPLLSG